MPKRDNISISVIRRMPRYYRFLSELLQNGTTRISSKELAMRMGLTASQIRQDLNCFGGFGQQGYGYDVGKLLAEIGNIIGIGSDYPAIVMGAGNLGRAVSIYLSGDARGFRLEAIFDRNPDLIGSTIGGLPVLDVNTLAEYCAERHPVAAFLCIPYESVEPVLEVLYNSSVRFFWNFSHFDVAMKYPDTVVENVHLNDSLMTLCYHITDHGRHDKPQGR